MIVEIRIEATEAAGGIAAGYNHLTLIAVNADGTEMVIRGGPEFGFPPFGDLVLDVDVPLNTTRDARDPDLTVEQSRIDRGSIILDFGIRNLDNVWDIMVQHATNIQSWELPYNAGQNSNSVVASVLHVVGIDVATVIPDRAGDNDGAPGRFNILDSLSLDSDDYGDGEVADDPWILTGTFGNDLIVTGSNSDIVTGSWGIDILRGGDNNEEAAFDALDYAPLGSVDVTINGTDFVVVEKTAEFSFFGSSFSFPAGVDAVSGFEVILGTSGNDTFTLNSITSDMSLYGGAGNDTLVLSDSLAGAIHIPGMDVILYRGFEIEYFGFETVDDNIPSLPPAPAITGTNGADNLNGTNGADVINGLGGNDIINGRAGNDTIDGGAGSDYINGGSGVDTVIYDGSYFFARNILTGNITATDFSNYSNGTYESDTLINIEYVNYNGSVVLLSSLVFDLGNFTFDLNFGAKISDPSIYVQDTLDDGFGDFSSETDSIEGLLSEAPTEVQDHIDWDVALVSEGLVFDGIDMAML